MSACCRPRDHRRAAATAAGLALLAALYGAPPPVAAREACRVELSRPPARVRIDYDPFIPAPAPQPMTFEVRNGTEAPCEVEVALLDAARQEIDRSGLGPAGVEVEIRPRSAELSRTARPGVFALAAPPGLTEAAFDVVVVRDAVAEAGSWPQPLTLALLEPGTAAAAAYAEAPAEIVLNALPRAQLNLSGSSGPFGEGSSVSVVDFGVAETGAERRLFVQTRTNAPARLSFRSMNDGRLLLRDPPDGIPRTIDYGAVLAGEPLDLTRPSTRDVDPPRTLAGQSLELILKLGDVQGAQAGTYSDELTIEISTL